MLFKTKHQCIVWLFVSLGIANGMAEARNAKAQEATRCKLIEPFHGGKTYYVGDRKKWSLVYYKCKDGYHTMLPNITLSSECTKDFEWDPTPPQCYQKATAVTPENGHIRGDKGILLHNETYTLYCSNGYGLYSEGYGYLELGSVQIRNNNGTLEPTVPICKENDRCKLKIYEGSKYYLNGTLIETDGRFPHDTQVDLQCLDNFDTFDEKDNFVNDTNRYLHMTCYQGIWKYMYKCKKQCRDDYVNKIQIIVSCEGSQDNGLKCDNGEWQGSVDCSDERKKTNADGVSEKFTQENIAETTGTVETTTTNSNTSDPASCMKLQNGVVKKFLDWYTVSCYEGFSLNLIQLEKSEYTCQNGELRSTIGNQIPECIQNNCVLPDDIDEKLSVKDKSRDFSLSAGSTVESGDHVYLNCSKAIEGIYEPSDRRFKCVKGQWKEDDEKDPNWVLGNNRKFPKCRQAICEPNCTNGGVCYKDDNCRCKHFTQGKRCEIVLCNEQCADNGGRCVTPTLCLCPEGRYGSYCEKNKCVNTFGKENDWYPKWKDLQNPVNLTKFIDGYSGMSRRACQQKCAELTDFQCMSVFYMKRHYICWGFSTADKRYFQTNRMNWESVVYIRSCGQTI